MGGPRPRSWVLLGSLHVSFFLGPGSRMGGKRQRSWAPIGLPSYFLSGLLHRVARCQEASFWAPGSDGGRMGGPRPRAGLPSCFLSGVLGRMGRGQGARRPSCFLFRAPSSHGWPRSQSWAPLASLRSQGCSHH